ncbi:hypothetical protein [Sinimarinibacterium flocculans]|uniref:hypothetical protein n=1 Tax=Sinimarinibacterium flocculans TaxID=985250 RepID=UPI002491C177|nr:hypothetical protein [Sinimarinibacterium flocculans]
MTGFRTFGVALVAVFAGVLAGPAQAGTTYCNVDVYTAYTTAIKRGWNFECKRATFVPEHAFRAISCQGKTPPINPGMTIIARFFGKATSGGAKLKNGWTVHSYEVTGGNWNKSGGNDATYNLVSFYDSIAAPNANFKRRLTKLKLKKQSGNCAKVYDEAF